MNKVNFTKSNINKLETKSSRYMVGDSKCNGLCIRISPTGHRSYLVYKKLHGKPIKVTLGTIDDLTIEQARKKAANKISQIAYEEKNPNELNKKQLIETVTLGDVFKQYISSKTYTENTINGYTLCINRDLSDWKDRPLKNITASMVSKRHEKLSKASETSANKVMRVLRAIFNFADLEYEDDHTHQSPFAYNPTKKLKRCWHKESVRKNTIAESQMKDWFNSVMALPNLMKGGDPELVRDYLQFVLLNGLRRREATKLSWDDIDFKGLRFVIKDPKNHEDLWLPLTSYSKQLLINRKGSGAHKPFDISEPKKPIIIVRKHSDIYFTLHDLRRTFITVAEGMDIGVFTIKALVNHKTGKSADVTQNYAQIDTERLRKPLEGITNKILSLAKINSTNITAFKAINRKNKNV